MELTLLWHRGPGLVPELPLLHEVRQGGFLPRHVAASCPPRRVQARGDALPRHPRERQARRGADGDVDPAGGRPARLGLVAPNGLLARPAFAPLCSLGYWSASAKSTMSSPASASRTRRKRSMVTLGGTRRLARAWNSVSPDIGALVTSVSRSSMLTWYCASTREMSRTMPG